MAKFAIVETGSKQYRVEPKTVFEIERLELDEKQKEVALDKVLLVGEGDKISVGAPYVQGAKVICDLIENFRGKKVISYKFRRRKNWEVKKGHRQNLTKLIVKDIIQGK